MLFRSVAVFFALILLFLHLNWIPWLTSLLSLAGLRFLGRISYSIYMFHVAVLGLMFAIFRGSDPILASWSDLGLMVAAFGLTVALALGTWQLFEQRLISLGHRHSYRGIPAPEPIR